MDVVLGECQMPTMYKGTNETISRLASTIREGLEDWQLVRLFWVYRDTLPKDDLSVILSIHERRIIQDVWDEDV